MAEIQIEKKERSPWPWVLGALALVVLVVLLTGVLGDDADDELRADLDTVAPVVETGAVGVGTAIPEVEQFAQWVAAMNPAEFGRSHEYTADGVVALTAAFGAIAQRDTVGGQAVDPALERARAAAHDIQTDPTALSHADRVQNAFTTLTELAAALQQVRFPGAETTVNDMRNAARAVAPTTPLLDQTDAVEQFFRAAADALEQMSEPVQQ